MHTYKNVGRPSPTGPPGACWSHRAEKIAFQITQLCSHSLCKYCFAILSYFITSTLTCMSHDGFASVCILRQLFTIRRVLFSRSRISHALALFFLLLSSVSFLLNHTLPQLYPFLSSADPNSIPNIPSLLLYPSQHFLFKVNLILPVIPAQHSLLPL